MMFKHSAIICLGSNSDNAVTLIKRAIFLLKECQCDIEAPSDIYPTPSGYYNCVAKIRINIDYLRLNKKFKSLESALGRSPEMKAKGQVPIDMDIVIFDNEIMRPSDYEASYFLIGYEAI